MQPCLGHPCELRPCVQTEGITDKFSASHDGNPNSYIAGALKTVQFIGKPSP